jgi:formate dehydrogenase maturation protein FdhE
MIITESSYTRSMEALRALLKQKDCPVSIVYFTEILSIQARALPTITVTEDVPRNNVLERLREGKSVLFFNEFQPDWKEVRQVCGEFLTWLSRDSEGKTASRKMSAQIESLAAFTEEVKGWYEGTRDYTGDPLLKQVIKVALKPFLLKSALSIWDSINQEMWRRKECPVCGGEADFAGIQKDSGARRLFCSRCDSDWLFQRLQCPYCGTQNQNSLVYYTGEGELAKYRIYICKDCKRYIKAVDFNLVNTEVLIPHERIITIDLDKQALEMGYKSG